ncbi:histidine phosphatase family protein [Aneurinibacillus sp. Ricciae_BoGa-3]|uniref:histidine phosphatase family protein n=1 Tax=Aneurinibacillus sp. Ricciae_BoGa-3 TaxID=3022697 RepID=UPI0023422C6D|nr:histidine phosphatase family protein [Aneurinibacillus sp. Ricciae_BoGa-3]WCK55776.1 histidine phosphatase family protein [Aneurinibacillus sp. Ricciae_BoGa-3]
MLDADDRNIFLIRHGETEWNVLRRLQGHSDIPLNERGREQANRLAASLKGKEIDYICSSDLGRAYHTAKIIGNIKGMPVYTYPELRERHYGKWEGQDYQLLRVQMPDFGAHDSNDGYDVEPFDTMQARAMQCIHTIMEETNARNIVVVSHGGTINALLHFMSKGKHGPGITRIHNTAINHVSYNNGRWVVHTTNDDRHLFDNL